MVVNSRFGGKLGSHAVRFQEEECSTELDAVNSILGYSMVNYYYTEKGPATEIYLSLLKDKRVISLALHITKTLVMYQS